ncbi:MAG TPA: hypothetical protein VII06_19275 [Chloroflexota bacterium]|jgi:hypothetical protein
MAARPLDALPAAPPAPSLKGLLHALADCLEGVLVRWLDDGAAIPGDMEGTLLLYFYDQQDAADALGRRRP